MSATCPGCGVAVVPGYVRCPKCQRPLPGNRRVQTVAGGTAVAGGGGRLPLLPIAGGAVVVLGIILYFVLGKSDAAKPEAPAGDDAMTEQPTEDTELAPAPGPARPPPPPELDRDPNHIDPNAVARDLERALGNRRMWSSVEVYGNEVEVRSSSCRDANMIPIVDAAGAALRNAGLTRVRCLENSGAVVFERSL